MEILRYQLIVGVTASSAESMQALLNDLLKLSSGTKELTSILICDNMDNPDPMRSCLEQFRDQGVRIHFVTKEEISDAAKNGEFGQYYVKVEMQNGIAFGRTTLHHFLYLESRGFDNPIAWILDDDMRIEQHYTSDVGNAEQHSLSEVLCRLKSDGTDIAIGRIVGDPPIPGASMLRTQLLDLDFNLRALCNPEHSVDREALWKQNSDNITKYPDFYYDSTLLHSGHLETPWWFLNGKGFEHRLEILEDLLARLPQISKGVNIFRPIPTDLHAEFDGKETPTRGGNTFVFNMDCLRDYPNISPQLKGIALRRGDTLWTILNRHGFCGKGGRKVVRTDFCVRQDRQFNSRPIFKLESLLSDMLGSAFTRSLDETLASRVHVRAGNLNKDPTREFSDTEIANIISAFRRRVNERLDKLQMNSWRIKGLVGSIRTLVCSAMENGGPESALMQRHINSIEGLLKQAEDTFSPLKIRILKKNVLSWSCEELEFFLRNLNSYCISYRERISVFKGSDEVQHALSTICHYFGDREFSFLAKGGEGHLFTDGALVYKLYHEGIRNFKDGQLEFILEKLSQQAIERKSRIVPLERFVRDDKNVIFVTRLVQGRTYSGGLLHEMLALLREARSKGIALTNISPENLISTEDSLMYVDLGRSIEPASERGFREMCKRAFLVYRWHFRKDLKEVFRKALHDDSIPELFGLNHFLAALESKDIHETLDDVLVSQLCKEKPRRVLDYGCGNGGTADRLAINGIQVTAYDIDGSRYSSHAHPDNVSFVGTPDLQKLLETGSKFDAILCNMVLCTVGDQTTVMQVLSELRKLVDGNGTVMLGLCNPFDLDNSESQTHVKKIGGTIPYSAHFQYEKEVKTTHGCRTDFHRPLSWYSMMLRRVGFKIQELFEVPGTDIARLCPGSDAIVFCLKPTPVPEPSNVSLLVKASAMEWRTIRRQVLHLIRQLEEPRLFLEKIVVIDSREDLFARQYDYGDLNNLKEELVELVNHGVIDRMVFAPDDPDSISSLSRKWFDVDTTEPRCENGQPTMTTIYGFERCKGEYVLHVDSDCLIGRLDRGHDYLSEMLQVFEDDPQAVTVSFPVAGRAHMEYTAQSKDGKWRTEVRCSIISKSRLEEILPLPNTLTDHGLLKLPWHRALDLKLKASNCQSCRGGDPKSFFIHVPNDRKTDFNSWYNIMRAVEEGWFYERQYGNVDLVGGIADWLPQRSESCILIVRGRNVPISKLRRCFDSLSRQSDQDWGLLLIDAGSDNGMEEYVDEIVRREYGSRMTFYRNLISEPPIANIYSTIHHLCNSSNSIIIMPDADDAFLSTDAISYLKSVYAVGADLAVGGLIRTDKEAKYLVNFIEPRCNRGGNVWQPVRTFRKYLFDRISPDDLKVDGDWVPHTEDWAFMIPMAELSISPVYLERIIYLYEPSPLKETLSKKEREHLIGKIVSKPSYLQGDLG